MLINYYCAPKYRVGADNRPLLVMANMLTVCALFELSIYQCKTSLKTAVDKSWKHNTSPPL